MITLMIVMLSLGLLLLVATKFFDIESVLFSTVRKLRNWSATLKLSNQWGAMEVGTILDALIVIIIGISLIFAMIPNIEESANTANITNTTTKTFGNLAGWVLPVIAIAGLIVLGIKRFLHWGGKGKG